MGSSGNLALRVMSQPMIACCRLVLGLRAQESLLRHLLGPLCFRQVTDGLMEWSGPERLTPQFSVELHALIPV